MRARIQYAAARFLGVASRPLLLFVANNYLAPATAQGLAVAFLATSLALVAIAADPHRRFYARHFAMEPAPNHLLFYVYVASVGQLGILGSAIVVAIALHYAASLLLVVACVGYFASEKLADELLRYRLFEHDFGAWGRAIMARTTLQLALFAALWATVRDIPASLAILALAIGNFAVFLPQLPEGIGRGVLAHRLGTVTWLVRRAARMLLANRLYWVIALLSSGIGYLDRVFALGVDKATLPLFVLVVMCFSIVQMGVDFFYLSRHRRDFLQQRVPVGRALLGRQFLLSFGGGLAVAGLACVAVLRLSRNGGDFPLMYVLFIAGLQAAVAVTIIPREISYWRHPVDRIFRIELVFWAMLACTALLAWRFRLTLSAMLPLAAACALVRLGLHVVLAGRPAPERTADRQETRESSVPLMDNP